MILVLAIIIFVVCYYVLSTPCIPIRHNHMFRPVLDIHLLYIKIYILCVYVTDFTDFTRLPLDFRSGLYGFYGFYISPRGWYYGGRRLPCVSLGGWQ